MRKVWLILLGGLLCGAAWAQPWQEGRRYQRGEQVNFQGQWYQARQAHEAVKGANWTPRAAPSLWQKVSAVPRDGQWREGQDYRRGEWVQFKGRWYQARQAHRAEPGSGWTPQAVPALWEAAR